MKKKAENWLKIAKYDLKAASIAFDNDLYLTCIEKTEEVFKETKRIFSWLEKKLS